MSWADVLQFAKFGGAAAIAGWIVFKLGEVWPWFQNLQPFQKRWVAGFLSLIVPIAAQVAGDNLPSEFITKWWPLLYAGGLAAATFIGSQVWHAQKLEENEPAVPLSVAAINELSPAAARSVLLSLKARGAKVKK